MGSNNYNYNYSGNERAAGLSSPSSSSSSRKGKKGNSDKPKQPQRGLGVAQLEKIRLNSQLGCSYLPSPHNPYASNFNQEDYRLHAPYPSSSPSFSYSSSSSPSYGFQGPHGVMMGLPDADKASITYAESQPSGVPRWHPGNAAFGSQHYADPRVTRSFFETEVEDSYNNKNKKEMMQDFMGSSSHNSESSNPEEIDLELRLSL